MRTAIDPSTRALLDDGRGRAWKTAVALVGAGLLVVVALVFVLHAAWPGEHTAPAPSAEAETTPSATSTPTAAAFGGPTLLPQPTSSVDGVPIGFPATPTGAVAAAYAYSHIATSLDASATLRALEQVADPQSGWLSAQRTAIADGVASQRSALGLAPVGPSDGATLVITPAGFQFVGRPTAESATVLTLAVLSGTAVDGTRTSGSLVLRWQLRWDGDRWRATQPHVSDRYDDLVAVPLTSDAVAKGWREARGG